MSKRALAAVAISVQSSVVASQNGSLSPHTRGAATTAQLREVVSGEFGRWGATFNTIATSGGNDIVHSDCAVQHERIRLMVQASKLYEVTLLVAYQIYFHEVMGIKHHPDAWAAAFDRVKLVPNFEYPIPQYITASQKSWTYGDWRTSTTCPTT